MKMNVHLNFQGNCAAAFEFYKKVFGAGSAFIMKLRRSAPWHAGAAGLEGQSDAYFNSSG